MHEHFILPDTQCREGVKMAHLEAAGNYIVDRQPDTIIHLGDHWDMASLSSYEKKGSKYFDDKTYKSDIEAGLLGMETFLGPIRQYNTTRKKNKEKQYKPRMIFLKGNHEHRIQRVVHDEPILEGTLTQDDFQLEKFGWETYEFLQPVVADGVSYCHYYYNPSTGKPYTGKAYNMLSHIGYSFTMGHRQGKDIAEKHLTNGTTQRGLIIGSFYQHDEEYKGYQGNNHWRGCVYKHEVKDGNYCLLELSLSYLLAKWR